MTRFRRRENELPILITRRLQGLREVSWLTQDVWSGEISLLASTQLTTMKGELQILKNTLVASPFISAFLSLMVNKSITRDDWRRLMQHKGFTSMNDSMVCLYEVNWFPLKAFVPLLYVYIPYHPLFHFAVRAYYELDLCVNV